MLTGVVEDLNKVYQAVFQLQAPGALLKCIQMDIVLTTSVVCIMLTIKMDENLKLA
jgi:hypothetical protein